MRLDSRQFSYNCPSAVNVATGKSPDGRFVLTTDNRGPARFIVPWVRARGELAGACRFIVVSVAMLLGIPTLEALRGGGRLRDVRPTFLTPPKLFPGRARGPQTLDPRRLLVQITEQLTNDSGKLLGLP